MKKLIISLFCIGLLAGLFWAAFKYSSSNSASQTVPTNPQTDKILFENQQFSTTTPYVHIDIQYPKFVGNSFSPGVIDKVNTEIKNYIANQKVIDDFIKQAEVEVSDMKKQFPDSPINRGYEEITSYKINFDVARYAQVYFRSYLDMGGAHGIGGTGIYVIDRQTGKKIEDRDVFKDVALLERDINSIVKEDVIAQKIKNLDITRVEAEENWKFFAEDSKVGWSSFAIKDEGIEFWFGEYVLGSYAEGEYNILVPWQKLGKYLKPDFQIAG